MLTRFLPSPRGAPGTIRFGSFPGFAWGNRHLRPSTRYSVSAQRFHSRVTASLDMEGTGILTGLAIGFAVRLPLRTRLTLIRLALIRKPWSCGEGVSHPLCRYLYLHLLFHKLQHGSRHAFDAGGMLPYRILKYPRIRQRAYTRLLSTPRHSTSELLRTL